MKIAITGPPERTAAWESHLLPHQGVSEIIIATSPGAVGEADACVMIEEASHDLRKLQNAVRHGWHVFFVAPLPTDQAQILETLRFAEEAGVIVQFAHWPSLSQATQWMMKEMPKPEMITVQRSVTSPAFTQLNTTIKTLWIDELAFCLHWADSGVRHLDANLVSLTNSGHALFQLFIRFDNSITSSVTIQTAAPYNAHHRTAACKRLMLDCEVSEQIVRAETLSQNDNQLYLEHKSFDPSRSAEQAVSQFLEAIQNKKPAPYTIHHNHQLCTVAEQVEELLQRIA